MKIIPILLIITLIACKKDAAPPTSNDPAQQKPMFPLKVGNKWTMRAANYDSLGAMISSQTLPIEVYQDTIIQNERWFIGAWIYTNRADGVYDYRPETGTLINLRYKYPATAGTQYPYRAAQIQVMSIAETVTVQGGTFVCYRYRISQDGDPYSADEYVAPGVGLVKEAGYQRLPSGKVFQYYSNELLWYNFQ